ncbi:ATP-binding protein [Methanimicrococcus hongohii]|uniref:ATP-binding protein n=1 Tax=Methanimicrococcus hongohii TaxID=3028295 RepID=UPI00292EFED9|nr:ATP-binding protein [Methanimicrococcus sp. Hf6]
MEQDYGLLRESLDEVPKSSSHAVVITGIRRCGKSTLLLQIFNQKSQSSADEILYLHFEDIRLAGFETSDLTRLDAEIKRRKPKVLFFDEIQFVSGWELFVSQLLKEKYSVYITGSNASLLSRELGTHLTGRHRSFELFTFSYSEFLEISELESGSDSLLTYLNSGGFPAYISETHASRAGQLNALADDILIRDIAVRHSLKDVSSLRQLAVYLMSNIGNTVSANKLAGSFGIKSGTTILDYFSYLNDSYLFEFLPQFSWSARAQAQNPKKIYTIDNGFIDEVSSSFTENSGHKLENAVYLHLRRQNKYGAELFYFKEKGECDFVVFDKGKAKQVVQSCFELNSLNLEREIAGVAEAASFFKLNEGIIVTFDQRDVIEKEGIRIEVVPAYDFFK